MRAWPVGSLCALLAVGCSGSDDDVYFGQTGGSSGMAPDGGGSGGAGATSGAGASSGGSAGVAGMGGGSGTAGGGAGGSGGGADPCSNGVRDGSESDVDCGGSCPACVYGQRCQGNRDCVSGLCSGGTCREAAPTCAAPGTSNAGCEFWAADLDQQDGGANDPASAAWGVLVTNVTDAAATVTIHRNDAAYGQPPNVVAVQTVNVAGGASETVTLPTRELDCGTQPNDYASPGTCLSSRAYRITSSSPVTVHQLNALSEDAYSNDASLLLPTHTLGRRYGVLGWPAGHPVKLSFPGVGVDRSFITVVGTQANTRVSVTPTFRIRGNPPIAATAAGGQIVMTLGPFDVLNLESDDATTDEAAAGGTDLSGSAIVASQPVAVFSGVESGAVPATLTVPTPPGWADQTCCLDHLEDQLPPAEALGTRYVIPRSPIRSTDAFREADVVRFVGIAETATVTTSLPAPFDSFTLAPGEVKTTWTQDNVVVTATKPLLVGQLLVAKGYVSGPQTGAPLGDPSLALVPPVQQFRNAYSLALPSWTKSYVVLVAPVGASVTIDASSPNCVVEPAGQVGTTSYESRRCELASGPHHLVGEQPFGVMIYGYAESSSFAAAGGSGIAHLYSPP